MTKEKDWAEEIDFKALVGRDQDFLRQLFRATLQEVLEGEMTDALYRGRQKDENLSAA